MTKKHINCEECGIEHARRGLRMVKGRLLCYNCFITFTGRIPGKYTKVDSSPVSAQNKPIGDKG